MKVRLSLFTASAFRACALLPYSLPIIASHACDTTVATSLIFVVLLCIEIGDDLVLSYCSRDERHEAYNFGFRV
jgi:hypothetical protein